MHKVRFHNIIHNLIFILTFTYLITCPVVHEISNDLIDYDLLNIESQLKKKKFKDDLSSPSDVVLQKAPLDIFYKSLSTKNISLSYSKHFNLNDPFLSTVRLIL